MKNLILFFLMSFTVLMTTTSCKKEVIQPKTTQPEPDITDSIPNDSIVDSTIVDTTFTVYFDFSKGAATPTSYGHLIITDTDNNILFDKQINDIDSVSYTGHTLDTIFINYTNNPVVFLTEINGINYTESLITLDYKIKNYTPNFINMFTDTIHYSQQTIQDPIQHNRLLIIQ